MERRITDQEREDIAQGLRNPKPRIVSDPERDQLEEFVDAIRYSSRYNDDKHEYRHVELPKQMLKRIPKEYFKKESGTLKLLWEDEWRGLGITQSLGWEHYEVHEPEPHILLFRREMMQDTPQATSALSAQSQPTNGSTMEE